MPNAQEHVNSADYRRVTPLEWAWLAGFMDGEGYFALIRLSPAARKRLATEMGGYKPRIMVGNTDVRTVRFMARTFPRATAKQRRQKAGNRPWFDIRWEGARACAMAHYLVPHLRGVKRLQARCIQAWFATMRQRSFGRHAALGEREIKARERIVARMTELRFRNHPDPAAAMARQRTKHRK